eukprot:8967157-Alexandrium_andersonii.AAC.1
MDSMLRQWWQRWRKRRAVDLGTHGELLALARGAAHPISPLLSRWLEQHGWDGAHLTRADAERWVTVSSNERAARRRLLRATGRLDGGQ